LPEAELIQSAYCKTPGNPTGRMLFSVEGKEGDIFCLAEVWGKRRPGEVIRARYRYGIVWLVRMSGDKAIEGE